MTVAREERVEEAVRALAAWLYDHGYMGFKDWQGIERILVGALDTDDAPASSPSSSSGFSGRGEKEA
jgi:hypothetical protein